MVDQEVADILEEIRDRVRSVELPTTSAGPRAFGDESTPAETGNLAHTEITGGNRFPSLPVLARAWDRLPPLVSNRTGSAAAFELWVKKQCKRALRWITWEQVNFNAATHQTFQDVVNTLSFHEKQLLQFHEELRERLSDQDRVLQTNIDAIRREQQESNARASTQQVDLASQLSQLKTQLTALEVERTAVLARIENLTAELRERDEHQLDEQRVCFKQLSLEASEAFVLQDRGLRELKARLEQLEREKP